MPCWCNAVFLPATCNVKPCRYNRNFLHRSFDYFGYVRALVGGTAWSLPHYGGRSRIGWRDYFLYVYYWEKNFPQSPTVFSLRGNQYKYITYYGLWDTDELYDIKNDPGETTNLIANPEFASVKKELENELYRALADQGGMFIPLNQPRGNSQNKRLETRGGKLAGDFPSHMVVGESINRNAR